MTEDAVLSPKDFAFVADLVRRMSGINLTETKRAMVTGRLTPRAKALGLPDLGAYCAFLASPEGAAECEEVLQAVTTNTTRFERERAHYDHLEREVLPGLVDKARAGGRVRIWSAGCSSGEEPYCLAMRILDQCPEAADLDVRILAVDIDRRMVARAAEGSYSRDGATALGPERVKAYFTEDPADPERLRVAEGPRRLIAFRQLNLLGKWPFSGLFDVIMCRNVTIYFDAETQTDLWTRLSAQLDPGGWLYTGHSETFTMREPSTMTNVGPHIHRPTRALTPGSGAGANIQSPAPRRALAG